MRANPFTPPNAPARSRMASFRSPPFTPIRRFYASAPPGETPPGVEMSVNGGRSAAFAEPLLKDNVAGVNALANIKAITHSIGELTHRVDQGLNSFWESDEYRDASLRHDFTELGRLNKALTRALENYVDTFWLDPVPATPDRAHFACPVVVYGLFPNNPADTATPQPARRRRRLLADSDDEA